jgi:Ni/Co efflux regulator RcnB
MKPSIRRIAALAAAVAFAAAPAFAKDKGHGHDKHDKHEEKAEKHRHDEERHGGHFDDRHREFAHRYYAEQYGKKGHCPPGLAKKHNGCMPPGHARNWAVGQPIPRDVTVYAVPQPLLVQLPPVPVGHSYSRVGADIVLKRGNVVVDIMLDIF